MVKQIVFLFPGQGAQYPGMGLDLLGVSPAAREIFSIASETLDMDVAGLIRDSDAEKLKRSDVSQIALTAASLAAAAALRENGIVPAACAGFSLGEYPALACAGVIGAADCFTLVRARGGAMQAAIDRMSAGTPEAERSAPGMAAVLGLAPEKVEELIAEWKKAGAFAGDLYPANINSPVQTVVSGSAPALSEAEKRFKEAGAKRFIRLQVAGPFHSPFMKEAADAFASVLEATPFRDPDAAFFSNVTGTRVSGGNEAKSLALRQICEGVRWTDEEAAIAALNPGAVFETGPGKVLRGLWRDSGSAVPCYGAGTAEEIQKLCAEFANDRSEGRGAE
ncbi:MAG: ACP S-malonyltransferase [Treponema sp.]|jgi:[acyl-carrier-protein] S-malonyltransferase|nr:ACP S-malonyltransferase [Treponema sp.]